MARQELARYLRPPGGPASARDRPDGDGHRPPHTGPAPRRGGGARPYVGRLLHAAGASAGTAAVGPGSWTRWPARCGSRRPNAATCSGWRVRARRPAPAPCGGCARTWPGCWTGCRRPVPSSPTRRTTSSPGTPWPRHCSAPTSETGRRTWPAAASWTRDGCTRAPAPRNSGTSRWRGCAGPPTATRTTRGWPPCWPNCTTAVRSSGRSGRHIRSTPPGTAPRPWTIRRSGRLRVNCDVLLVPEDDQEVVLMTADPGSPVVRALRRLAGQAT